MHWTNICISLQFLCRGGPAGVSPASSPVHSGMDSDFTVTPYWISGDDGWIDYEMLTMIMAHVYVQLNHKLIKSGIVQFTCPGKGHCNKVWHTEHKLSVLMCTPSISGATNNRWAFFTVVKTGNRNKWEAKPWFLAEVISCTVGFI